MGVVLEVTARIVQILPLKVFLQVELAKILEIKIQTIRIGIFIGIIPGMVVKNRLQLLHGLE
jgi:hypothetical protein